MATIEEVYREWRASLKSPDESLFYYHPGLDRIILGLAIYTISSQPILKKLGKHKYLELLSIYATDLITAWIDDDETTFESMFKLTLTVAEAYVPALIGLERKGSNKKTIRRLSYFYAHAIACGGDMNPELAESLLDDLSTDGEKIYSEKIEKFGADLIYRIKTHGQDIPLHELNRLNGW